MPLWLLARMVERMEPQFPFDDLAIPEEATGHLVLRLISPIEAVLSVLAGSDLKHNSHGM